MTKGQHYRKHLSYTFNRLGHGVYNTEDAKRIYFLSGNITSGRITIYETKSITESIIGFKLF